MLKMFKKIFDGPDLDQVHALCNVNTEEITRLQVYTGAMHKQIVELERELREVKKQIANIAPASKSINKRTK